MHPLLPGLSKCLAHVFNAVVALVMIVVRGFGVRQEQDEAAARSAPIQHLEGMPNCWTNASVARRRDPMEPLQP